MVLKPLDLPLAALQWQGDVLTRLESRDDLRVLVPLRAAADGQWTSDGWTAWRYQPGEHLPGRWHDIIGAGQRLHAALQDEPEPAFLSTRTDIWSIAQGAAPHTGEDWVKLTSGGAPQLPHGRVFAAVGPGRWRTVVDGGWGAAGARPGAEIGFTDARGGHWIRPG